MAHALSTLHHITARKLSKLDHHRATFEADKKAILANVETATTPLLQVEALLKGFERYGITPTQPDLYLENLERFVRQAKHDSSVSDALLQSWKSKLVHELDVVSRKYDYAALFGKLVTDWIENPNASATSAPPDRGADDSDSEMTGAFEKIGRKEMYEQRKMWESLVFAKRPVDQGKIDAYLNEIFGSTLQNKKAKKTPLQTLRDSMRQVMDFKSELNTPKDNLDSRDNVIRGEYENRFTIPKLKSCIDGVLRSNIFAGARRDELLALKDQPAVLGELVDVLNMDLEALDEWDWGSSPVPLQMRRELNGKYRVYMNEEAHQAILLQFVGKTWAVALKNAFTVFYHSGAWLQTPHRSMGRKDRERRELFLAGHVDTENSVRNARRMSFQEKYFMTQLPTHMDADEPEYMVGAQAGHSKGGYQAANMGTKEAMMRLVTTELLLNTKIYGEFLVLQSDFKWFGPSLPHDTIFAVLKFLGVPGKWLRFFQKFLEVPVVFEQDGSDSKPRKRVCGVPMSHVLSDALSEAVLFCLDFAVNKRTGGSNIYRFHDDLWFWGQESTCVTAWNALQEFSTVMGLELNPDKTGTALVLAKGKGSRAPPPALPQGPIKWGLLKLDAAVGRWTVDQAKVDEHIKELGRQLRACRSVLSWVQAWNTYVSHFFSANLGRPARCLGRQHNDMIIATFEQVQHKLFAGTGAANVTEHLRMMLKDRFGVVDTVPDGFFYFPHEFGGLGLRNPLVTAFSTYKHSSKIAGHEIDRIFEDEQEGYERFKEDYEAGGQKFKRAKYSSALQAALQPNEPFMSFEEFTRYREEVSAPLRDVYLSLQDQAFVEDIKAAPDVPYAVGNIMSKSTPEERSYWHWICSLYAGDMKERFGGHGMQLGERSLLPVGLLDVLKSEKFRWEG